MKDRFTNEYIAIAFGVMLFASGMMILLIKNWKPYVGGWVFGCLIAMAMFKLMFFTFSRAVEKTERGASVFVGVHYFFTSHTLRRRPRRFGEGGVFKFGDDFLRSVVHKIRDLN